MLLKGLKNLASRRAYSSAPTQVVAPTLEQLSSRTVLPRDATIDSTPTSISEKNVIPEKLWSKVYLEGIESRWVKLPECEQAVVADRLALKQLGDWKNLTLEEKRAAYFIAYGPYNSRLPWDPLFKWKVIGWCSFFLGLTGVCWYSYQYLYVPKRKEQSEEWIKKVEEYSIENKANPFSGPYAKQKQAL